MKIKNSLPKSSLLNICKYFGLSVNLKTSKSELFKIISDFDEEKYQLTKSNKVVVEEISKIIGSNSTVYREGKLYDGIIKNSSIVIIVLDLETLETNHYTIPVSKMIQPMNLFFYEDELYAFTFNAEIFTIDLSKLTISNYSKLFLTIKFCLFRFQSATKVFFQNAETGHNYSYDLKSKEILELPFNIENEALTKLYGVFYKFDSESGKLDPIELLKHLYNANSFLKKETGLLYISNGTLFQSDGIVSNEILVFSQNDLKNPLKKYWTSEKVRCVSTFVHGDYIYFNGVFQCEKDPKVGLSRAKLVDNESFSLMLRNPYFSDFTFVVNDQKYFSHKFILSEFTELDLSGNELIIKMNEPTFKKAMEFIYDGIIPSLDSSEISELKDKLQMKIQSTPYVDFYKRMLSSSDYFDFIIKSNEAEIKCHRLILSRESEYFKSLFLGNFNDSNNKEITFEEMSTKHIELILEYFYCRSLTTENIELIIELIESSNFLVCPDFTQFANDKLLSLLNSQNLFGILKYASKEGNIYLKNKCVQMIKNNYSVEDLLELILKCDGEIFSLSVSETLNVQENEKEEIETDEPPKKKRK
jgi:hypothetical protein